MSREIKFRVWDGVDCMSTSFTLMDVQNGSISFTDDRTVMQYTGLKDANGVEIYEGDLIAPKSYPFYGIAPGLDGYEGECKELNYVGEVFYSQDDCLYAVELHVVSSRVSGRACGSALFDYRDIIVIGNIHQNPELLPC